LRELALEACAFLGPQLPPLALEIGEDGLELVNLVPDAIGNFLVVFGRFRRRGKLLLRGGRRFLRLLQSFS
jgi:hypothetical protein